MRPVAAIIEMENERDRRECVALDTKVVGANRALAQWLIEHPVYSGSEIARWLNCSADRIHLLRKWARNGYVDTYRGKPNRSADQGRSEGLKANDNFQDDELAPRDDVEDPAQVLTNILDTIKHAKAVAEAYRKILKASPFDRKAKAQIHDAINQLIVKWRTVQSTLDTKGQGNG